MSETNSTDPVSKSAAKKKRKSKKKANDKSKDGTDPVETDGTRDDAEADVDDGDAIEDSQQPVESHVETPQDISVRTVTPAEQTQPPPDTHEPQPSSPSESVPTNTLPLRNGSREPVELAHSTEQPDQPYNVDDEENTPSETSARLDAMAKERDNLRVEITQLRESLRMVQEKHEDDLSGLRGEVEDAQSAKESAESQYRTLLGKVNTIRSQLGERLKADAEELSNARTQIEELHEENRTVKQTNQDLQSTISQLQIDSRQHADEVATLRSRSNLSQTNWAKERDELISKEAFARDEFESARQAMQDWEVLAMEERSLRENLGDRVAELEDQLNSQREMYERVARERDDQNSTVDGLQRALQDIQDARKRELRELVENSQSQLEALRSEAEAARSAATASATDLEATRKELERALPFEKEVREKNLLIGKLRHEAVILNDHLTKALRFLKRGKPEDNVDRQIVTNHFLHFLMLDRSDPKKFQVLQLIAALLGWTEEQREQAGLARPGASNSALRVPLSPFRRTPGTPSLTSDFMPDSAGGGKESLAELWSEFLEREAHEGGGPGGSRANSVAGVSMRSQSITSPTNERQGPPGGLGINK